MRFQPARTACLLTLALLAPVALRAPFLGAHAQQAAPAAPLSLLPADVVEKWKLFGPRADNPTQIIEVTGQPFARAIRVSVAKKPKNFWNVQLGATASGAIAKGDKLLLSLWVRGGEIVTPPAPQGPARVTVVLEENRDQFSKLSSSEVEAGDDWKRVQIRLVAGAAFEAGAVQLGLQVGHRPQIVEFGGVTLENYGQNFDFNTLPSSGTMRPGGSAKPAAPARRPVEELKGGVELLAPDAALQLETRSAAKIEAAPVTGRKFTTATRVVVAQPGAARLALPIAQGVKAGDALVAALYLKGTPKINPITGRPRLKIAFEAQNAAFPSLNVGEASQDRRAVSPAPVDGWRRIQIPFTAPTDAAPGAAKLILDVGSVAQEVWIGGVTLTNFGAGATAQTIEILPKRLSKPQFGGPAYGEADRKPDAPWRLKANARIEKLRKGDLLIQVRDAAGKAVPGAKIEVRMKKHGFVFGTAISGRRLMNPSPDFDTYRETAKTLFNGAVLDNDMKWYAWEANRQTPLAAVKWLRDHVGPVRGHTLVWPNWQYMPKADAEKFQKDPTGLQEHILKHIRDEAGALRGQIRDWDVINEPYTNYRFMEVLGDAAMIEWFKTARQADPQARLFVNDYDNIEDSDAEHAAAYEKVIRYLLDNGAPLDGIGLQSHFFHRSRQPARTMELLDRYAKFGLPLQITELDVPERDDKIRADQQRDLITLFFSHPAVDSITHWGFWEGSHWYPAAAMFDIDWTIRPNGQAYRDLVFKTWWSDAEGQSDARGQFSTRGFYGDYEITVSAGGKTKVVPFALQKNGKSLIVALN